MSLWKLAPTLFKPNGKHQGRHPPCGVMKAILSTSSLALLFIPGKPTQRRSLPLGFSTTVGPVVPSYRDGTFGLKCGGQSTSRSLEVNAQPPSAQAVSPTSKNSQPVRKVPRSSLRMSPSLVPPPSPFSLLWSRSWCEALSSSCKRTGDGSGGGTVCRSSSWATWHR